MRSPRNPEFDLEACHVAGARAVLICSTLDSFRDGSEALLMMGTMPQTPFRRFATLSLCLLWGSAYAQDSEPYEVDPPSRAARLSFISGDVSLQPAGEQDWAPALINRPLTTGDKLWTEHGARAEIYVGPAAVRLDGNTGFSFLNVNDDTIQMRMTAGVVNVSVPSLEGNEHIEIDTPNVAISLLRAGYYRVEVNDAGDSTVVKVSEGDAQATGPSQDVVVHAQQAVTFTGIDDLVVQTGTLGAPDDFDSWSLERDRRDLHASTSRTAEYVAPDVTGYQDLEDNGTWSSEPEYGNVWTPSHVAVRLGAVQLWPLGVGFSLGLHVDRQRALGLRAVSLRPMGAREQPLVLGARTAARARGLCTGARRLGRFAWRECFLVSARSARSVCAVTPLQPALRGARERLEHHRQSHVHFAGLRKSRRELQLSKSRGTGRRDDGAARHVHDRGAHRWSRRQA